MRLSASMAGHVRVGYAYSIGACNAPLSANAIAPVLITDNDPCTTDACEPMTGAITHLAISGCKPCALPADCDDANECTSDTCPLPAATCVNTPVVISTVCNDADACTTGETCSVLGVCGGGAAVVCAPPK